MGIKMKGQTGVFFMRLEHWLECFKRLFNLGAFYFQDHLSSY